MPIEEALEQEPFYNVNLFCEAHRPSVEFLNLAEDGLLVDPTAKAAAEDILLNAITECPDCIALQELGRPMDPAVLKATSERAWKTVMERVYTRVAEAMVRDVYPEGVPEGLTEEDVRRDLKDHAQSLLLRGKLAFAGEDEAGGPIWPESTKK